MASADERMTMQKGIFPRSERYEHEQFCYIIIKL